MELIILSLSLLLFGTATADPKVVSLPFTRTARSSSRSLSRRDASAVTLQNRVQDLFYSVNVTVGTPPQQITLDIDTGSADIWFPSQQACDNSYSDCLSGAFTANKSSTFKIVSRGNFEIEYVDGSEADGDYISDVIDLGNGLRVTNQTMALATDAEFSGDLYGIMGIGFEADESQAQEGLYGEGSYGDDSYGDSDSQPQLGPTYPNLVSSMVNEGLIQSRSYSLWLDDLAASTGTILFGGYDADQYLGEPTVLAILPDDLAEGIVDSFIVQLSSVSLTKTDGVSETFVPDEYPVPVIFDSGSTLTDLPPDSFYPIADYLGAYFDDEQYGYYVPCEIANWTGSVDYGFGGASGVIIQVPFAELALPVGVFTASDGTEMCQFGIDIAEGGIVLFGDTFLRSAYVIYDLEAQQIALAQSAWNSTTSNVQELPAGKDLASKIQGARTDTTASISDEQYTRFYDLLTATATQPLNGIPQTTAPLSGGVTTSLSLVAIPTEAVINAADAASSATTGTARGVTTHSHSSGTATASSSTYTGAAMPTAAPVAAHLLPLAALPMVAGAAVFL